MPTVSELTEIYATATRAALPTIRMSARRLTDEDLLPKGSGRRVPKVSYEDAARLLLAVGAGHAVKDSARMAVTYSGLVHDSGNGQTALEAVVDLLRSLPTDPTPTDWMMEVYTTFPQVVIKNPHIHSQYPSHSERTDYGDFYIPQGEDRTQWPADAMLGLNKFSGAVLYPIACALAADQ